MATSIPSYFLNINKKLLSSCLACVFVVNALLAYWLYGSLVSDVENKQLTQLANEQAQQHADSVSQYLLKLNQRLKPLSQQDSLVQALETSNTAVLSKLQQQIQSSIPEAVAIRILKQGITKLDREAQYPIRYAEIDMINRTEKREEAYPEAVKLEGRWFVNVALGIEAKAKPNAAVSKYALGTLFITLDDSKLLPALSQGDETLGHIQLLQNFVATTPQILAQTGGGNAGARAETLIKNSHWKILFTPSQGLVQQASASIVVFTLIVLFSLALSVIATVFLCHYLSVQQTQRAEDLTKQKAKSTLRINDVLDIDVHSEDEDILGLSSAQPSADSSHVSAFPDISQNIPEQIFRAYDIRGIVGEQLTTELAEQIGQAVGSEALDQGEQAIVVGRDGRTHSPELCEALINGIRSTGCKVINIGIVPTALVSFATHHLDDTSSGVMVTASHNPAEYNGFKMTINGNSLSDDAVQDIRSRILRGQFHNGQGDLEEQNVVPAYIERIFSDVALVGDISIVIDASNGVTSNIGPELFEELGCEVTPLYCEMDGTFPNHSPDPTRPENLQDLIAKVQEVGADLGICLDGDGDRIGVVTPKGEIIWPDRLLMLFAKDIVARNPGADVIFDVKCTRQLNDLVTSYGGRPIMWKTGHSHMKSKMQETGALLGGELSGHIFIKDRWYGFDDGLYVAARLLEIMTLRDQDIDSIFASFPALPSTPEILVPVTEEKKFKLVDDLIAKGEFKGGTANTIDGLRVEFAKGWGLVRASNTSPMLTLRFEGETESVITQLQSLFKRELLKIDDSLNFDF